MSIRVSMTAAEKIELSGLQEDEVKSLEAMVSGHTWCLSVNGRLETRSRWEPLPAPAEDESMMPFWQPSTSGHTQLELRGVELPSGIHASIMIQNLCGYRYSPENYRTESEKLEAFGFQCLRSRRGENGRFWEMWYLPGTWSARGELALAIQDIKDDQIRIDTAVKFLCRKVSFGSLDVSWQRAAMVIDD